LVEEIKLCFYPMILFVISFIPLGLPIIFLLESQYFGKQCILVYLENLNDNDGIEILKKNFRFLPKNIEWLPNILSLIPF